MDRDAARTAALDAMEQALVESPDDEKHGLRDSLSIALDALLVARQDVPCPECCRNEPPNYSECAPDSDCETCAGSGSVPGPSLIAVMMGTPSYELVADVGQWKPVYIGTVWQRLELTLREAFAVYRRTPAREG